jgi:hypothetical protein
MQRLNALGFIFLLLQSSYGWLVYTVPHTRLSGKDGRQLLPTRSLSSVGPHVIPPRTWLLRPYKRSSERMLLCANPFDDWFLMDGDLPFVPLIIVLTLGLFAAAQGLINEQLRGEQGLSAFLKDGRGYSKSGFQPLADQDRALARTDPLPWLKLPRLDFVQVAGQDEAVLKAEQELMDRLDGLRIDLNDKLREGRMEEALFVKRELETLMRENGIEYQQE